MLKRGDVVSITYYEGQDQLVEPLWTVAEYDNGIVRLEDGDKTKIVNLRSIGFLQAKIEVE